MNEPLDLHIYAITGELLYSQKVTNAQELNIEKLQESVIFARDRQDELNRRVSIQICTVLCTVVPTISHYDCRVLLSPMIDARV